MDKRTQNLMWSCLPREVRKEVKRQYRIAVNGNQYFTQCTSEYLFGYHNLTSDTEGEEVLTVSRKKVQELFANAKKHHDLYTSATCINESESRTIDVCLGRIQVLDTLFGSKCLPDESESPKLSKVEKVGKDCNVDSLPTNVDSSDDCKAEPKFKVGDKVKVYMIGDVFNGAIGEIIDISNYGTCYVLFPHAQAWFRESDLEPYTEPEEDKAEEIANKAIKPVEKHFDTILKDSFRNERRLNIATQMVKAIMQCPEAVERIASAEADSLLDDILHDALHLTDRLLAECEKGGSDGN